MSRGNGKKESRDRTDGASGIDRIHSVDGGRVGSWSLTEVEDDSDGSGSTVGGNDGPVEEKAWFEPVGTEEISDCPGGICPVPWAKDNEEESVVPRKSVKLLGMLTLPSTKKFGKKISI